MLATYLGLRGRILYLLCSLFILYSGKGVVVASVGFEGRVGGWFYCSEQQMDHGGAEEEKAE